MSNTYLTRGTIRLTKHRKVRQPRKLCLSASEVISVRLGCLQIRMSPQCGDFDGGDADDEVTRGPALHNRNRSFGGTCATLNCRCVDMSNTRSLLLMPMFHVSQCNGRATIVVGPDCFLWLCTYAAGRSR